MGDASAAPIGQGHISARERPYRTVRGSDLSLSKDNVIPVG
jgi:hypothetical protein